jgi:hypothetical protein
VVLGVMNLFRVIYDYKVYVSEIRYFYGQSRAWSSYWLKPDNYSAFSWLWYLGYALTEIYSVVYRPYTTICICKTILHLGRAVSLIRFCMGYVLNVCIIPCTWSNKYPWSLGRRQSEILHATLKSQRPINNQYVNRLAHSVKYGNSI